MNFKAHNHFTQEVEAGTHSFEVLGGAQYVIAVTAENGGPTEFGFKDKGSDTTIFSPENFTSGEAIATVADAPLGTRLYITLAGEEFVSIRIQRRPDE